MKRRDFVKKALAGASALASTQVAACAPRDTDGPAVHARPTVRWRLASSFPRGLDTLFGSAEVLADRVAAMSEGRFQIRAHPAGEIVPGLQVLDAVQQDTVQVAQTASYYFIGKNPALAFDACVPFGLTARQQQAWLHEGGGLDLMRGIFADFGVLSFPAGNTGAQMGGWFKNQIQSLDDLKGLKMRIPGLGGAVMSRLGVTVQVLAGGDIFPALERGAIDATEWVGPYDDEKLGFHKVVRNYYYPGWWEPGPSLSFYVNREAWSRLPAVYQEIFTTAAREAETTMQARYDAKNPPALARLLADGVQLRPFPDDVMRAAQRTAFELMEEEAARDATYRRVYEEWNSFRKNAFDWFGTAELAYASYAFRS